MQFLRCVNRCCSSHGKITLSLIDGQPVVTDETVQDELQVEPEKSTRLSGADPAGVTSWQRPALLPALVMIGRPVPTGLDHDETHGGPDEQPASLYGRIRGKSRPLHLFDQRSGRFDERFPTLPDEKPYIRSAA
jgi:hypothetical protein